MAKVNKDMSGRNNPMYKHGMRWTRLYNIWCSMKQRCCNKKDKDYKRYGGRGIRVCDEWIILTDDEESYPDCFEYVLVEDDIGDRNVACCYPDYDWYISNGENSLKLIGEVIKWKKL